MNILRFHPTTLSLAIALALGTFAGAALADPPSRVARLGYLNGDVVLSPAGEQDWIQAGMNRPLTTGDRVWAQPGARAELQVGGAMVRLDGGTAVSVLDLDDTVAQLRLTQGRLNVRVRALHGDEVVEVATPNLALSFGAAGAYSIEVDPDSDTTTVWVRSGTGEVFAGNAGFTIGAGQSYRFRGDGLGDYQQAPSSRADEFERWASDRDRRDNRSQSARYVPRDMVGYRDLDEHGSWRVDATYGNVWTPNRVEAGWSPYSDGHWAWVDPWGWTWIDEAPWGFAVSHYGRWNNFNGRWGWVPGQTRARSYYAPALVAFVGGSNWQVSISSGGGGSGGSVGGVGWFPLAPREVYRPTYEVSRGYYENVNRSNTVVNNTVINNTYNTINTTNTTNTTNVTQVVYANRNVPGAVVAVPTADFGRSQRVARAVLKRERADAAQAVVMAGPGVVPTAAAVRGAAQVRAEPPKAAFAKPVIARRAPPPAPTPFAAQLPKIAAQGGRPLDATARKQIAAPVAVAAPVVRVAAPAADTPKVLRPLPARAAASGVAPDTLAQPAGRGKDAAKAAQPENADAPKTAAQARRERQLRDQRNQESQRASREDAKKADPAASAAPAAQTAAEARRERRARELDEQKAAREAASKRAAPATRESAEAAATRPARPDSSLRNTPSDPVAAPAAVRPAAAASSPQEIRAERAARVTRDREADRVKALRNGEPAAVDEPGRRNPASGG